MARVRYSGTSPNQRVMARVNQVFSRLGSVDVRDLEGQLVDAARSALCLDRTGSDTDVRWWSSFAAATCTCASSFSFSFSSHVFTFVDHTTTASPHHSCFSPRVHVYMRLCISILPTKLFACCAATFGSTSAKRKRC
mgnify:CR=1 FL=1